MEGVGEEEEEGEGVRIKMEKGEGEHENEDLEGEEESMEGVIYPERESNSQCGNCARGIERGEETRKLDDHLKHVLNKVFGVREDEGLWRTKDLVLCSTCSGILDQLHVLYNAFMDLAKNGKEQVLGRFLCRLGEDKERTKEVELGGRRMAGSSLKKKKKKKKNRNGRKKATKSVVLKADNNEEDDDDDWEGIPPPEVEIKGFNTSGEDSSEDLFVGTDGNDDDDGCDSNTGQLVSNDGSYSCKPCGVSFEMFIQLLNHRRSNEHQIKAGLIKPSETRNSFPCPQPNCGKVFYHKKRLARHRGTHFLHAEQGTCDRCGKKFKNLAGLKVHYAAHVRDDNKLVCKNCGKKFRKKETLERHMKVDHLGFKPYNCTQCEKSFRLRDKLKLHVMAIHEGKKPFPCPKCEKSFRTKYHLKIHEVSQHIQGGDSSIGCSQCKRKFPDRDAREKHVVIHEQEKIFKCVHCGKGFHTTARLKLHEKSHLEIATCLCPVCGKAYKHVRDLRLHEVIHQDESTYRFGCGDCPRRFYRVDLLRVHQSNEKHFSPDVVGPTISKANGSKPEFVATSFTRMHSLMEFDDSEDEEGENGMCTSSTSPDQCSLDMKNKVKIKASSEHHKKYRSNLPKNRNATEFVQSATTSGVFYHHPGSSVIQVLDNAGLQQIGMSQLKGNYFTPVSSSHQPPFQGQGIYIPNRSTIPSAEQIGLDFANAFNYGN